jgi:NAD(P)-dependent dehydrogenase (short-subunit alcohol dehydrogenase family)
MRGKTALVTGATAGIGFYVAQGLAREGARVVITGRDPSRGERALEELRRSAAHDDLVFLAADHATVGGNQQLAMAVRGLTPRLDVLVNNVGRLLAAREQTADGYETSLAVNAVGPFALTEALRPALHAAGAARVVNVVSSAHALWRRDPFEDLQATAGYVGLDMHARAKLLNLLWTFALARRLAGSGVTVNATNPGMAWTPGTQALTREAVPAWRWIWPIVRLVQRRASAQRAARSPLHLAESPELATVTGAYFESGARPARPSASARDPSNQERAWQVLSDLVTRAPTAMAPAPVSAP